MAIPAAPLTRANMLANLEKGLKRVLFNEHALRDGEYTSIYNIVPSEKAYETDNVWGGFGTFGSLSEGGQPQIDNGAQAYTRVFTALGFALGYKITKWALDDDQYGTVMKLMKSLARSASYTKELLAMGPFNDPTATQYTFNGTDYGLLNTAHGRLDDGTWSNRLSSGADLSLESLETLLIQAHNDTRDHRGFKVRVEPKILAVPVGYKLLAQKIVNSVQVPFSTDNHPNVKEVRDLEVKTFTHMTNDGRWYLLSDKSEHTLQWIDREDLDLQTETDGTGTGNKLSVASFRAAVGITSPVGIWGSL